MKSILFFAYILLLSASSKAQSFPKDFLGNWKGELSWYQSPGKAPQKIMMELRVQPTDSAHKFSWQMTYGTPTPDNRPYTLIAKDTAKGHWIIDENNGILLDQYWIAGRLSGAFTVQSSTIINNYWLQNGQLHVEFYNISAKAIATTGKGDKEIPFVDSYQVRSYQKAVLNPQHP